MSILTKELKEVSPNWVVQMVLTYCHTFSKPFQFRIWTKVSIGLDLLGDHLVLVGRDYPLEGMAHHGEGDRGLGQSGKV